jgi:FkbM family methyltransferase
MSDYRISNSQNREDIILSGFFKDVEQGFYVDVGANHPDILSITKYFYDRGWSGINIEPNAHLYKLIKKQRQRDINLNIGAADKPGELVLREYPGGDGLSTFSKETQAQYQKDESVYKKNTLDYEDYKVSVKPLKQIFEEHKVATINFMNIDVEGFEYNVIKGNDWSKYRPQVICVEANHIAQDWRPMLEKARYELVFFDGLNNYYVAAEHHYMADSFSYVDTVLLGEPVVGASFHNELMGVLAQLNKTQNTLIYQGLIEQNLRGEIYQLHRQLANNRRIRSLVKQLAGAINGAILTQIEKLNKPKIKRQIPLEIKADMALDDLMAKVKLHDLLQYYGANSTPSLTYRVVRGGYIGLYSTAKSGARKLMKLARGTK